MQSWEASRQSLHIKWLSLRYLHSVNLQPFSCSIIPAGSKQHAELFLSSGISWVSVNEWPLIITWRCSMRTLCSEQLEIVDNDDTETNELAFGEIGSSETQSLWVKLESLALQSLSLAKRPCSWTALSNVSDSLSTVLSEQQKAVFNLSFSDRSSVDWSFMVVARSFDASLMESLSQS